MVLLLFWGVVLFSLALGPLFAVGVAWSPFAAVILFIRMSRRGYRGIRYALLGGLYSVLFFVPWVLAMLEDWNPEDTGGFTTIVYTLLYSAWAVLMIAGLTMVQIDLEGTYWFSNYAKLWLPITALAWVASLWWLIMPHIYEGENDGLPRPHQVLPFALFTVSVVCLLAPPFIEGLIEDLSSS